MSLSIEFLNVSGAAVLLRPIGLNGKSFKSIRKLSMSDDHFITNIEDLNCVCIKFFKFGP